LHELSQYRLQESAGEQQLQQHASSTPSTAQHGDSTERSGSNAINCRTHTDTDVIAMSVQPLAGYLTPRVTNVVVDVDVHSFCLLPIAAPTVCRHMLSAGTIRLASGRALSLLPRPAMQRCRFFESLLQ